MVQAPSFPSQECGVYQPLTAFACGMSKCQNGSVNIVLVCKCGWCGHSRVVAAHLGCGMHSRGTERLHVCEWQKMIRKADLPR
jgi:hypothetical protein